MAREKVIRLVVYLMSGALLAMIAPLAAAIPLIFIGMGPTLLFFAIPLYQIALPPAAFGTLVVLPILVIFYNKGLIGSGNFNILSGLTGAFIGSLWPSIFYSQTYAVWLTIAGAVAGVVSGVLYPRLCNSLMNLQAT